MVFWRVHSSYFVTKRGMCLLDFYLSTTWSRSKMEEETRIQVYELVIDASFKSEEIPLTGLSTKALHTHPRDHLPTLLQDRCMYTFGGRCPRRVTDRRLTRSVVRRRDRRSWSHVKVNLFSRRTEPTIYLNVKQVSLWDRRRSSVGLENRIQLSVRGRKVLDE